MRFPVRPGKVACAGIVGILMVLPNSIWKGADANGSYIVKKVAKVDRIAESGRSRVKFGKQPR